MAETSEAPTFGVADSLHAPFIYYEAAPAIGTDFGVIQITLSAHRLLIGHKNETIVEPIAVAHLRGTRNAARLLRDALNKVLSVPE
jgi:putative aminopeptidase FrvX